MPVSSRDGGSVADGNLPPSLPRALDDIKAELHGSFSQFGPIHDISPADGSAGGKVYMIEFQDASDACAAAIATGAMVFAETTVLVNISQEQKRD